MQVEITVHDNKGRHHRVLSSIMANNDRPFYDNRGYIDTPYYLVFEVVFGVRDAFGLRIDLLVSMCVLFSYC